MVLAKNIPRATVRDTHSLFRSTCADYIYNYVASDKSLSERNKLEGVASARARVQTRSSVFALVRARKAKMRVIGKSFGAFLLI